ncbi:Crp/Fnr family transcriptional regulator [Azospirillum sp. SYSU D00513]|uniref:Crp/Fnr family transcriptional regulator n=1 Tax=Azospirillum sp. SYSU D00513 TaxID=2812561 RepID=UPI001FFF1683|nr:Crp/Fnr family transcriptional regulator [Azospirillum sp. SYSU D00513]
MLRTLQPSDFEMLGPQLELVDLPSQKNLHFLNEPIRSVYFPEAGLASIVSILNNGQRIEAGVTGREGIVGIPVLLGAEAMPMECFVQIPGAAWRLDASALRDVIRKSPTAHVQCLRYVMALFVQIAQTAVCNGTHTLLERLARWLLMAHDRSDGDQILLTQESIAAMLGVRRAGVTVAAGSLQKAGLIAYGKGSITIVNRPALEETACECYGVVRAQFDALLGSRIG